MPEWETWDNDPQDYYPLNRPVRPRPGTRIILKRGALAGLVGIIAGYAKTPGGDICLVTMDELADGIRIAVPLDSLAWKTAEFEDDGRRQESATLQS